MPALPPHQRAALRRARAGLHDMHHLPPPERADARDKLLQASITAGLALALLAALVLS